VAEAVKNLHKAVWDYEVAHEPGEEPDFNEEEEEMTFL
jgi:hypothetical protein